MNTIDPQSVTPEQIIGKPGKPLGLVVYEVVRLGEKISDLYWVQFRYSDGSVGSILRMDEIEQLAADARFVAYFEEKESQRQLEKREPALAQQS